MAEIVQTIARGLVSLVAPVFPGEPLKFGPRPPLEVLASVVVTTAICWAAGHRLTRSTCLVDVLCRVCPHLKEELRDEAWIENSETKGGTGPQRKRSAAELLFIFLHNSTVALIAAVAWLFGSSSLALHAFTLEVGYEIFDTFNLGPGRLEPETLIHHIVAPICILCSTQTDVDFRVLCHLCICIDAGGAVLGYSKFLLRFAHVSSGEVYRRLAYMHGACRVFLPLIDTVIIVHNSIMARGGLFHWSNLDLDAPHTALGKTDWTQMYFWAMAVLNAFNLYFWCVIKARAKLPQHVLAQFEMCTGTTGA